jgi:hypothetical protein
VNTIATRLNAMPTGGAEYARWVTTLKTSVQRVLDETAADENIQNRDKWRLVMNLSRAGANAFWALSLGGGLSMATRAGRMRLALAHDRLYGELNAAYRPTVRIREATDVSQLAEQFYGGSVLNREMLTERAKADVTELLGDVLSLSGDRAAILLARIPDGVIAWR